MRLILLQGDNYADPPGDYARTDEKIREKNIWVCESNSRMMFYAGGSWVITATQYMQEILMEVLEDSYFHQMLTSLTKPTGVQTIKSAKCTYQRKVDGCLHRRCLKGIGLPLCIFGGQLQLILKCRGRELLGSTTRSQ